MISFSALRVAGGHHGVLYGVLACAHWLLCSEAMTSNNWLVAACSFAAGMAYLFFASHSLGAPRAAEIQHRSTDVAAHGPHGISSAPFFPEERRRGLIDIALPEGVKIRVASDVEEIALATVLSALSRSR